MPVYFVDARDDHYESLVDALARELKEPGDHAGPAIRLEGVRKTHPRRITVEWDQFDGISSEIRAEIIYEAIREAYGQEVSDSAELLMGVTPAEAKDLNINVRD